MITRIASFIILVLATASTSAQSLSWLRTFDFGQRPQSGSAVCPAPDGSVIVAGSGRLPSGEEGPFVAKISPAATVVWMRNPESVAKCFFEILPAPGGGYYALGYAPATADSTPYGSDVCIVRLDSDGYRLWERTRGTPFNDSFTAATATADGGVITAGQTYVSTYDQRLQVLRFDSEGNLLKVSRIKVNMGFVKTVSELPNGEILLTGNGSWVARLSRSGDSLFAADAGDFDMNEWLYPAAAAPTSDGGLSVAGTYIWDQRTGPSESVRHFELARVILDSTGAIRSLRRGYDIGGAYRGLLASDGTMLLTDRHRGSGDTVWFRLLRMNPDGDLLSRADVPISSPYPGLEDLCELPNGDVVVVGDVGDGNQERIFVAWFSRFTSGADSMKELPTRMDLTHKQSSCH